MKVVILGGTAGMGRALSRRLCERGDAVFLLGRDPVLLQRSITDLQARRPPGATAVLGSASADRESRLGSAVVDRESRLGSAVVDLEQPEGFAAALDAADAALGGFDAVIVTAALFATQEALEADSELARRLVTVNYANTLVFCEHARRRLLARGGGHLVVFSSVAGERGRKPVAIYGSSKAGLSAYLEALDHKFHDQGLQVLCVKPGFVHTGMTAGLKPPPFAGDPDQVAADVLRAMQRRAAVLYTPRIWALIMLLIRHLPRAVMRRIGF